MYQSISCSVIITGGLLSEGLLSEMKLAHLRLPFQGSNFVYRHSCGPGGFAGAGS